ncbi:MAG: hypothetical protein AAF633_22280 [Chloroflexota bacterium]
MRYLSILFYIVLGLIAVGVVWFASFRPILVLPRIRLAPGFVTSVIAPEPTAVEKPSLASDDLRGGFTFYAFTFSDCLTSLANKCVHNHDALSQIYATINQFNQEDLPIRLVTILLDEEPVGSAQLSNLGEENWLFVQGEKRQMRYVVGQGFQLFYAYPDGQSRTEAYVTPKMVLVDGLGMIRNEYRTGLPDKEILIRDINLLTQEVNNQSGVSRLGYEAAHLFVCYP